MSKNLGMAWVSDTGEFSAGSAVRVFDPIALTDREWNIVSDHLDGQDRYVYVNAILNSNFDLVKYIERMVGER